MRTTATELVDATTVRRAATALAARARAERAGRLSLNQVAALGRIRVVGPITPGELAAQLGTLPQSLTRTLQALEDAGLVMRTADPTDRRSALLLATAAGRRALREEMAPRDRWTARAMQSQCTPDERQTLLAAAQIMQRLATFGSDVAPVEA